MQKTLKLLQQKFQSSSGLTPQFKTFAMTFKREFTKFLTEKGCTNIEIGRGHFFLSGFFTTSSGQIFYFNLGDVRWPIGGPVTRMLYRTAKHYKDYTGGINQYILLEDLNRLTIFRTFDESMQRTSQ